MTKDDALKLALEQLMDVENGCDYDAGGIKKAIESIEEALAQPEPFTPDWVNYRQGKIDGALEVNVELLEALKWMVANDDTNEGEEPVDSLGGVTWNEYNEYWVTGLNKARAAITKATGVTE